MKKEFNFLDILPLYKIYYKDFSLEKFFEFMRFVLQNNEELLNISRRIELNFFNNIKNLNDLNQKSFSEEVSYFAHFEINQNNESKINWSFCYLSKIVSCYLKNQIPVLKQFDASTKPLNSYSNMKIVDEFLKNHSTFEIEAIPNDLAESMYLEIKEYVS